MFIKKSKKLSSVFLALIIAFVAACPAITPADSVKAAETEIIYGDCNNDGSVNALDFAEFKKYLMNQNNTYNKVLDLNIDNEVNAIDYSIMKKYLLGIVNKLPYSSQTDTQSPTIPADLVCTSKTSNSVSLKWTASSDNVAVTGYEIYKDGVLVANSTTVSYTVTGLSASTTYIFSVKAVDAAGNKSSEGSKVSVTTDKIANRKLIALSFDDGPSATTTLVLNKLEKNGVKASFFLIGQNINEQTIPIMKRELSLGCEIENHSWSHSDMSKMASTKIKEEIDNTNKAIYKAVGVTPKFFRPPYISTSNSMFEAINLPFICGINCNDWESGVNAKTRATTIINNAKDGDIVLLHDFSGNTNTVDALDEMIAGLKNKGFEFVTVSQMFKEKGVDPSPEYKMWTNVSK